MRYIENIVIGYPIYPLKELISDGTDDQDCHYVSLATCEGSAHAAKEDYDHIRRLRQKNNGGETNA